MRALSLVSVLALSARAMGDGIGPALPDVPVRAGAPEVAAHGAASVAAPGLLVQPATTREVEARASKPAIESTPLGIPERSASRDGAGRVRPLAESEPAPSSFAYARTLGALGLVVVLIIALAIVARRLARRGGLMAQLGAGGRAPSGVLEVLGRFPAGRGCTLVLLKLDRRVLLVCQTSGKGLMGAHAMSTLCEITEPEQVASILVKTRDEQGESMARRFQAVLAGADERTGRDLGDDVYETSGSAKLARDVRDVRDVRHVGPAQPMAARVVKPRVVVAQKQGAPIGVVRTAAQAAPAASRPSAEGPTPAIDRVRGRVAAMRSAKAVPAWEVRA